MILLKYESIHIKLYLDIFQDFDNVLDITIFIEFTFFIGAILF